MGLAGSLITPEVLIGSGYPALEECEGRAVLSPPSLGQMSPATCEKSNVRGGVWGRWVSRRRMEFLKTQAACATSAWSLIFLCRGDSHQDN